MAKYIWFIVDTATGVVKGTNDIDDVMEYIALDSYVLIHNEGAYYCGSTEEMEIEQLPSSNYEYEGEDDNDDFNPNDDPSYGSGN